MPETYHLLQHLLLGCPDPECNYIYTQDELYSYPVQNYINTHNYADGNVENYSIEYKKMEH